MMRFFILIIFLLVGWVSPVIAQDAQEDDESFWDSKIPYGSYEYSGPTIFKTLPSVAETTRTIFVVFSVLILALGIKRAGEEENPEDMMRLLINMVLVVGATTFISPIIYYGDLGFNALGRTIAPSPFQTAGEIYRVANSFQTIEVESLNEELIEQYGDPNANDVDVESEEGKKELLGRLKEAAFDSMTFGFLGLWEAGSEMKRELFDWTMTIVYGIEKFRKWFIAMVLATIVGGCLMVVVILVNLMEAIRFFLAHAMSILLPCALATLLTKNFANLGRHFVMQFLGVLAWPLAFALGNLGLIEMFKGLVNMMIEPVLALEAATEGLDTDLSFGRASIAKASMLVDSDSFLAKSAAAHGHALEWFTFNNSGGNPVQATELMYSIEPFLVLKILIGTVGIVMYIFTVYLTAPLAINGLFASGASIYHSTIGNSAQQSGQIITNAARLAALKGAGIIGRSGGSASRSASSGGGGSPPWAPQSRRPRI